MWKKKKRAAVIFEASCLVKVYSRSERREILISCQQHIVASRTRRWRSRRERNAETERDNENNVSSDPFILE